MNTWLRICLVLFVLAANNYGLAQTSSKTPEQIFQERIMPIFKSADPSSCVQCHLASVDLKNYILPSHEATFLSLRDQGLVDLEHPKQSKILELIGMGHQDNDEYARRIHAEMRDAEFKAFSSWIAACCDDQALINKPKRKQEEMAKPAVSDSVIRFTRKDRVLNSFVRNVWSQRMRCFPCHTPNEIGPRQKGAREKYDQWVDEYGEQMDIFRKTPEETLRYWVSESQESKKGLPILNLEDPTQSLILLKPMAKVPPLKDGKRTPTYESLVYHMGGLKIHENDHSHIAILNWINDYAAVTQGLLLVVDELPPDNWLPTQRILRIKEVPEVVEVGTVIQMTVHAQTDGGDGWTANPIGFTQGTVTPRRIANGAVILLAPTDPKQRKVWASKRNKLPPGNYQIRVFVAQSRQPINEPELLWKSNQPVQMIEVNDAKWQVGFPKAQWLTANDDWDVEALSGRDE